MVSSENCRSYSKIFQSSKSNYRHHVDPEDKSRLKEINIGSNESLPLNLERRKLHLYQ